MTYKMIPLENISDDRSFCFTARYRDITPLIRSVSDSGIHNPLPAVPSGSSCRLIAGFSRYEAALAAGTDPLPVRVLDADVPDLIHLYHELLAHRISRPFNLMEKARISAILSKAGLKDEALNKKYASVLGFRPGGELALGMQALLGLHSDVQKYIEQFNMPFKQAELFVALSHEEQKTLMSLAADLRIRPVELLEILSLLDETAAITGQEKTVLLTSSPVREIREDAALTRNQQLQKLKNVLYRKLFPALSRCNRDLEQLSSRLDLPAGIRISWDRTLERPGMLLTCRLLSRTDLKSLDKLLSAPGFKKVLDDFVRLV